jgi:hypothetical protein
VPRLRMCWAIPTFPHTSPCCDKYAQGQLYFLFYPNNVTCI